MDPLSITASALTVVTALDQAYKCAQRLRAIRQAPGEIRLLLEEVADLTQLLEQVQSTQSPPAYGDGTARPNEKAKGLDWQLSRTSTKLSELDALVEDHASRTDRRRLDRGHWGWIHGRRRANALRDELRDLRLNLTASLGANTSHAVGRVETAIERVNIEQAKTTQLLSTLVSGLALEQTSSDPPPFEISPKDGSLSCTFRCPVKSQTEDSLTNSRLSGNPVKMTRRKPQISKAPGSDQAVEVYSRKSTARCKDWCSCNCHKRNVLRVKNPSTIGSLSLAYSGLPWLSARCDEKSCRSRSVPSVAVTFQFPPWIWKRYLSTAFTYTQFRGPQITNFSMPRIVDWSSKLWGYGISGNLGGIQNLYTSGIASPWDVSPLGGSLLHYATDHGHWDLCKFLVREGASTDIEDDFNNTPTSIIWEKILSRSLTDDEASAMANVFSDTDFLETRQFTILHKIVLHLIPRTLESELEYSTKDLDAVDSNGRTCVSWAAARGDAKALRILLGYGADANISDGQGCSPLHHASSVACINLLINAGADIKARNIFGHTPLHSICRGSGSLSLLQRLVEAGIDINARDDANETALANAVYCRYTACALYLLENDADMNMANGPNASGDGPIQFAIMQNMHDILRRLLANDVIHTRTNSTGSTILHIAAQHGDFETISILKRHGLASSINVAHLNDAGKTARDILAEREKDDESEDVETLFEELLQSIEYPQHHKASHNELEAGVDSITTQLAALDALKIATITSYTPVSSEDEDDEDEEGEIGHNPPVFFDAVEDISSGLPMMPAVEIVV